MATKKEIELFVNDICDSINSVVYPTLKGWNKTVQLIASDLSTGWCLKIGTDGKVAGCEEAIKEAEADYVLDFKSDAFEKLMRGEINAEQFVGAHWKVTQAWEALVTKGSPAEVVWFLRSVVG